MPAKGYYAERNKFPLQNGQADTTGKHALPPLPFGVPRPKQNKAYATALLKGWAWYICQKGKFFPT